MNYKEIKSTYEYIAGVLAVVLTLWSVDNQARSIQQRDK